MFKARTDIDSGTSSAEYPTWNPNSENPFKNYDVENVDESHHLDDVNTTTSSSDDENPWKDSLLSSIYLNQANKYIL